MNKKPTILYDIYLHLIRLWPAGKFRKKTEKFLNFFRVRQKYPNSL